MGVKVSVKMSKRDAIAAVRGKPTKKAKPAKKAAHTKKKTTATVAVKSKKSKALAIPGPEEQQLRKEAAEAEKQMPVLIEQYAEKGKEILEVAQAVAGKKLWKRMPTPYKSFTEWLGKYADQAHVSTRTLWGSIGFAKAVPQLTAGERKKIGPRKGAKLTAAAKTAASRGEVLPPEVLDKAPERTEAEVEKDLVDRGLISESPAKKKHEAPADPLEYDSSVNTFSNAVRKGGSGVVEGAHGDAQQFGAIVQEACNVAEELYGSDGDSGYDGNPLEFICRRFLKAQYDGPMEKFHDTTNQAAFDELFGGKPANGKKKGRK